MSATGYRIAVVALLVCLRPALATTAACQSCLDWCSLSYQSSTSASAYQTCTSGCQKQNQDCVAPSTAPDLSTENPSTSWTEVPSSQETASQDIQGGVYCSLNGNLPACASPPSSSQQALLNQANALVTQIQQVQQQESEVQFALMNEMAQGQQDYSNASAQLGAMNQQLDSLNNQLDKILSQLTQQGVPYWTQIAVPQKTTSVKAQPGF